MTATPHLVFLTVIGAPNAPTLETTRSQHNAIAGSKEAVAGARSLGDLSHLVYVPLDDKHKQLVFMDIWRDHTGMNQFFSNEQVQQGGARIFKSVDHARWEAADGFVTFHIPSPEPQVSRIVGLVRGTVASFDAAREIFNAAHRPRLVRARELGQLSHEVFRRATQPGEPESMELLGLDVWTNPDGMATFYGEPAFMQALSPAFTGPPTTMTLKPAPGSWVQW